MRLRQNRMAHASELLEQIARSGLRYVEVPVTIEYSAYSLAKGQKLSDSLSILVDLSAQLELLLRLAVLRTRLKRA